MIDDHYVDMFRNLAVDAEQRTGYAIPSLLSQYTIMLLADHVRKTHWYPDPNFAERYLQLKSSVDAKELADECLFISAVFPEYATRRGMNITYYQSIGSSCYRRASHTLNEDLFIDLSKYFVPVVKWTQNVVSVW